VNSSQFTVHSSVHSLTLAVRSLLVGGVAFVAACAAKAPVLPSGTGTPFADYQAAYQQATAACRSIKTITASLQMSGKAGKTRLRGGIDAGFEAPAKARLEGRAPFGKPVFILVADSGQGTLVLPREDRVLTGAAPDQIVEALAGVRIGPDVLRMAISGCGLVSGEPSSGRSFPNGWSAIALPEGTTYVRQAAGAWQVAGSSSGPVTVTYAEYDAGRPATIRLRAGSAGGASADLTLRLSDVSINTTLNPRTFDVELPEHPVPLTLEELRRAGPLGGS
jgi:outer membrane lipoprotein-sorting protein